MKYTDGNDYSLLKPNGNDNDYECVFCGEEQEVTVIKNKDICHECGYVYE